MRFIFTIKIITFTILCVSLITILKNIQKQKRSLIFSKPFEGKKPGMKYILLWTKEENIPFADMGLGQSGFIKRKCPYTNCIVSGNESLLGTPVAFDAVLFAAPELRLIDNTKLPAKRLPYQKYVFASIESPKNYPLCFYDFNGYFNWTWTYKLDSDIRWGYIVIRDSHDNVIGPKKDMHWMKWSDMKPVSEMFKKQLKSKRKAAAWFVSNCKSVSRREGFVWNLKRELMKYDLDVDVFGACGIDICPRDQQDRCNKIISEDYFFYLSFENAFSEDYVTEKLLLPLQNNAVPIVYGGANYTRFMPDQAYLNAIELGVFKLAEMINVFIKDPESYADFFRWKNHYSYHKTLDSIETNEYCNMCAALNDEESMRKITVYEEFDDFWEISAIC